VININTLISAYHFGKKIADTYIGSTLYQKFNDIKNRISPKTWLIFNESINTCFFSHYYSFGYAYKKIKDVSLEKEGFYKKCFIELQDCSEVQSLIEEGNQLAKEMENSLFQMLANLPSREPTGIFNSLELYRAWMNVFYQLHSTKLFAYLHHHKDIIKNKQENIHQFLASKKVFPFSKHNRLLIRKLAKKETDYDTMYFYEFFDSLRNSILQVTFETHFKRSLILNKNEMVEYKEKKINKIRVFSTKVYGSDIFRYNGSFILLAENNKLKDIGLIKRRVGRNIELGDESLSTIEGLLYPKKDYKLFVPDVPN